MRSRKMIRWRAKLTALASVVFAGELLVPDVCAAGATPAASVHREPPTPTGQTAGASTGATAPPNTSGAPVGQSTAPTPERSSPVGAAETKSDLPSVEPAVPAPPAHAQAPGPSPQTQAVIVFDATSRDAELQVKERDARGYVWRTVCAAPCTARMPAGARYVVSGPGVSSSRTLIVPATPYLMHLHAKTGSSRMRDLGVGMAVVGGVVIFGGMIVALNSTCWSGPCTEDEVSARKGYGTIGAVIGVSGGVMLFSGIALAISNVTRVSFSRAAAASKPNFTAMFSAEGLRF